MSTADVNAFSCHRPPFTLGATLHVIGKLYLILSFVFPVPIKVLQMRVT